MYTYTARLTAIIPNNMLQVFTFINDCNHLIRYGMAVTQCPAELVTVQPAAPGQYCGQQIGQGFAGADGGLGQEYATVVHCRVYLLSEFYCFSLGA